jgi:bile acid:Na+ symporter, BASS family
MPDYAALMQFLGDWVLPGALVSIMFSMGLSLTAGDFRAVFANGRTLIFAVCAMLVIPPVIGVSMAALFAPTAALAVGFVLLATCPGGMLSNLFTDFAKGDLALSLSMTIVVSMIYILLVPFYAHFAVQHFMGLETEISVPLSAFVWKIFSITILPASLGFALRALKPGIALGLKGRIKAIATVVLFTAFGFILADQIPILRENFQELFWMTVGINLLTLGAVLVLCRMMAFNPRQRIAVGVEHLIRQEGTAIYIAVTIIGSNEMSLPMIMNTPVALVIVVLFVFLARRLLTGGRTAAVAE